MAIADCNFFNVVCLVSAARGDDNGDPVKPTYYIEGLVVLPLLIVAFVLGRWSRRKS